MTKTTAKREPHSETRVRADLLRPLNLPRPVRVELDDEGLPYLVADSGGFTTLEHGSSTTLKSRGSAGSGELVEAGESKAAENRATGKRVESILEIWCVHDEWWREPISRRYVEVILEGGKHVILYEDLITDNWFLQQP